jgi:DNA mismatch repair protein MutL
MESLTYAALSAGKSGSQELLVAEMLRLEPREALIYEEATDILTAIGFGSRLVGDRTIMVTAVPLILGKALPPASINEVLGRLAEGEGGANGQLRTLEVARMETAACHASVRARESLTAQEARVLLRELEEHPEARTCPHGRPTVRELPVSELGNFFGRTSHKRPERV